ncbi:MAG: DUF4262 domain-containing protein [Acidimicrobiia bacterium]
MRDCYCLLCAAGERGPADFEVVTVEGVGDDPGPGYPSYAYTAGLWHSYGHPEVVICGLADAEWRLERVAVAVAEGRELPPDQGQDDILGDVLAERRPVLATWHHRLFPALLEFYRGQPVPVVQLAVVGVGGQLRLWGRCPPGRDPEGWPFPDPPETLVAATVGVAFTGAPVLLVAHDEDGEWQFFGAGDDDFTPVHLAHLLRCHPGLATLGDLPVGWEASAGDAGSWHRTPAED